MLKLLYIYLWAGCFLFFTPAPLTWVYYHTAPLTSHFRSSPVKVLICCFGFLNSCKHLLHMQRKGEREECSDIHFHSSFSATDSSAFFTSSHTLPLFKTTLTRVSMSKEDKNWSVGGGGEDQDHMQPKQLIYIVSVIREINIKNVRRCEKYCPGLNLCLRKRQECGTTNQLMSSLRRRMCRKTKVILRGWCRRKEKLIQQREGGRDGLR